MNNKIKICHFVSGLKSGGVESMIYNYCSRMERDKYEFILVYQHEPSIKNLKEFEKIGFKMINIPSKRKHPLKNYFASKEILKNNDVDVVHCHMTLMNFIPLIAAKKENIKIRICHSHNNDVRNKNIFLKCGENILKKVCIKNSTHLIACGKDAGNYMYGKNSRYMVINNALNLDKYKYSLEKRKKIRQQYNINDECYVIGHIGRFTEQKNHKFLINIFKEIYKKNKNIVLFLVGDGELHEKIKEKYQNEEFAKKMIFVGIVDNVNEYYSAFDIFILPSLWEGLPVVSIEAQASGVKCLLSRNIDNNAVICENCVKLIELDEKCWQDTMSYEISKGNNYNRNVNMEKLYNCGYDIKKELKKLEKIYEEEKLEVI